MNAKRMAVALGVVLFAAGCSRKPALHLTIGTTSSTEGSILVEVAAQQIEKQLGVTVVRKVDLASTSIGYESLTMSAIDIYPEDTNAITTTVLKDPLDTNPTVVFERVRGEMQRLGRIYVSNPLGIQRKMCMVVRASDARDGKIETLTDASKSQLAWTLGVTSEFVQRPDGYSALMKGYSLPLKVAPKPLAAGLLYPSLSSNQVSIIAGYDTDGLLAGGSEFKMLTDDRQAFRESRKCFLVRQDTIDREPKVRTALEQLSGKFSNETIQKLNNEVDALRRPVREVAAGFLKQAGL